MLINYKEEKAQIVELGHNEAKFLLDLNTKNRKVISRVYTGYYADIKSDKFKFNGASIVVSDEGVLLDGQHRLLALEKAENKYIKTVLVTGVKTDTMETIDTGAVRKGADVLSLNGVKRSTLTSSTVKSVLEEHGLNKKHGHDLNSRTRDIKTTNDDILKEYLKNKEVYDDAIIFGDKIYSRSTTIKGLTPTFYASMLILLSRENPIKAKNFLEEVGSGHTHGDCFTAVSFREKMLNATIKKISVSGQELRDATIYYFRAYCEGKNVSRYKRKPMEFLKKEDGRV